MNEPRWTSAQIILASIFFNDECNSEVRSIMRQAATDAERLESLEAENGRLRGALKGITDLYDTDEGCRSLPQYKSARNALKED